LAIILNNLLIVTAHPYTESFNFALRSHALTVFETANWKITTSDLYQQAFNPLLGSDDFTQFSDDAGFSLAGQQSAAYKANTFHSAIKREHTKLLESDLIILQFPLWWGSFPAILKGWVERVLSYDFAYGAENKLAGKSVMFSVTTGGAKNISEEKYYADKIAAIESDVFNYLKMNILPTFICHGPAKKNSQQRKQEIERLTLHLKDMQYYLLTSVA